MLHFTPCFPNPQILKETITWSFNSRELKELHTIMSPSAIKDAVRPHKPHFIHTLTKASVVASSTSFHRPLTMIWTSSTPVNTLEELCWFAVLLRVLWANWQTEQTTIVCQLSQESFCLALRHKVKEDHFFALKHLEGSQDFRSDGAMCAMCHMPAYFHCSCLQSLHHWPLCWCLIQI